MAPRIRPSPFARKVHLCLAEKDLEYQLEIVLPFGPPAWYRQRSPLGRIPSLKDSDFSLADSSVIRKTTTPSAPTCRARAPSSVPAYAG
jgi:glutathione S-transferase